MAMSAIAANNLSATDNLLALLRSNSGTADAPSLSATTGLGAAGSQGETTSGGNPATFVELSDHAREVLARNSAEQVAAAQLQSFVESRRDGGKGGFGSGGLGSGYILVSGGIPTSPSTGNEYAAEFGTQDGSMYGILVTPTEPGSAVATVLPIVTPKVSFSNQVQAGGFTVSAAGDASNGTYSIQIDGPDGFQWSDQQLDPNLGQGVISGSLPPVPGALITATPGPGNIETITFSANGATAESVSASSGSGTVSMSTASALTLSETVSIDFSTGEIELKGSAATMQ
jgi:hypothetical protein